jgi:hypothetical protein
MKTSERIAEAVAPPVAERARVADTPLSSLNPPGSAVDAVWVIEARCRLDDLRQGRVEAIPGETVFERVRQICAK